METVIVYTGLVACPLEKRAVKDDVEGGASFVAALTYNVEGLEILFKTVGVFSCEGMTDSHVQGGAEG